MAKWERRAIAEGVNAKKINSEKKKLAKQKPDYLQARAEKRASADYNPQDYQKFLKKDIRSHNRWPVLKKVSWKGVKSLYKSMPHKGRPLKIFNLFLKVISFIFLWPIALAPIDIFSYFGTGFPNFIGYILIWTGILIYIFFFDFLSLFMKKHPETEGYEGIDIFNIIMTIISLLFFSFIYNLFGNWKIAAWATLVFLSLFHFYQGLDKKHKPKFIKTCVIILVLLLVFFFFKQAFIETGRLDSIILPLQQKLGFGKGDDSKNPFEKFWDELFHPEKHKDFGSFEDQELKKKDIGIEINNFKPIMSTFYENQPITVRGTIEAASLYSEDSNVIFNCEMEDYNGALIVTPNEAILSGNAIKLIKTVACVFNEGLSSNKKIDTKSVKLISSFDKFYTESTYIIYYLNRDRYNELYLEGKNPFDVYGWDKSLLGGKNIMNSKVSPGPIDVIIGSAIPQPFIAGDENLYLEVLIKEDNQVELNEIKDFKLFVPNGITLSDNINLCSFKPYEESIQDGNYQVYTLRELDIDQDLDIYNFNCFFSINELSDGEYRGDYIKVEMDYSFDITKRTVVSITKIS